MNLDSRNLIEVKELSFSHGTNRILTEISISVKTGDFLGILGPNGAGKTTLLRCMTGTLRPSSGKVLLEGQEIQTMERRDIAKVLSVVAQEKINEFDFTVEELVTMGRLPHLGRFERERPEDQQTIAWAMEVTNVIHLRSRLVTSLSGGEMQRVMLAKALAQEPRVLFLDEPTSHLDINYQVEMLNVVKRLNAERGLTVVAVMHDINLAASYCDNIVLLSQGCVFAVGPTSAVFSLENIKELYGLDVIMLRHPFSGKPLIFPAYGGTPGDRRALSCEQVALQPESQSTQRITRLRGRVGL